MRELSQFCTIGKVGGLTESLVSIKIGGGDLPHVLWAGFGRAIHEEKGASPSLRPLGVSIVDNSRRCGPNYLGFSLRFASFCTDFVVADLSIGDFVERPHAAGGFVICLANTR